MNVVLVSATLYIVQLWPVASCGKLHGHSTGRLAGYESIGWTVIKKSKLTARKSRMREMLSLSSSSDSFIKKQRVLRNIFINFAM